MRTQHGLNAVGDEFPRGQRILHAAVAHGDAVIHADGVELKGHATGCAHGFTHFPPHHIQMHMTGDDLDKGVGDGDKRLVPVVLGLDHAGGAEQAAVRGADRASFDGVTDGHGGVGDVEATTLPVFAHDRRIAFALL